MVELATKTLHPTFTGYTFTFQPRPSASTVKSECGSLFPWNALTDFLLPWDCQLDGKDTAVELGPDDQIREQAGCIIFGWEGEALVEVYLDLPIPGCVQKA